ncbi:hypothetical protein I302_104282 [Kwoniella bestiolae CBS 10118]|uniref:Aldose reductase n=1 Tax=Kwoniella bestiolae CBS 10118 TaxID=1296100 RepID=A0A1B9GAU5_9TREE|nr:aldose reductase [Kwoniella bestiolae CBS 10118]OCF28139.1 aldose reductase [Kwoniella bestiolae CBS 10118]
MTRTIKLSDGKSIPALQWGNGSGGLNGKHDPALEYGITALKAGVKAIDTAELYKTEVATGEALKQAAFKKEDIWVTTKNVQATPEVVKANVQDRLSKLGFKPDLLLIHNPFVIADGKIAQFWTLLEDLVLDGTLEGVSLGVSNFRPQDLEAVLSVARIKPVVNQLEYHPYVLTHLQPVLDIHSKHGIVTEAYGPLTPVLRHPTGGPIKPILERIAQRLSKETGTEVDTAAVLLLWTIGKGVVAVTTSTKEHNIKKIVQVDTALPDLTKEEIEEIEAAGRKVHFRNYKEHMSKDFPAPNLPEDL